MGSVKRIAVATDFSKTSEGAVQYAQNLAKDLGGKLEIIHIFDSYFMQTSLPYFPHEIEHNLNEYMLESKKHGQETLEKIKSSISGDVNVHFLEGNPKQELVKFTEENKIDIFVLGSHGYTGLDRLVMGSVAEYVVRHSSCPVLIVRGNMKVE